MAEAYDRCLFNILGNHQTFWKWLYYVIFLLVVYEYCTASTYSPALGIVSHFNFVCSDRCVVVSQCTFNQRFPNDTMFMCLFAIYLFCGEYLFKLFTHFKIVLSWGTGVTQSGICLPLRLWSRNPRMELQVGLPAQLKVCVLRPLSLCTFALSHPLSNK